MVRRSKKSEPVPEKVVKKRGRPRKVAQPVVELATPKEIILHHMTEEEVQAENKRRKIMWAGVVFLTVMIVSVWTVNLGKIVSIDGDRSSSSAKLLDFRKNISQSFNQISQGLISIKEEVASTTVAVQAPPETTYNTNIDEVNRELEQIINSASSTINNK